MNVEATTEFLTQLALKNKRKLPKKKECEKYLQKSPTKRITCVKSAFEFFPTGKWNMYCCSVLFLPKMYFPAWEELPVPIQNLF